MIEKKRGTERIFVLSKLERITDSCMIKVKALSRKKQKLIKGQDMESFATDVAKSTLDKLVDATIVQSRYICCFTRIVDDFEKEKEALQAKRETVKEYVQLANRRDENIRSDVTFWQEQADKLIEEDTKTKVTCFFGWCPNCKWRHSRGKELAHNTEEIKRLIKEVAENNFRSAGIPRSVAGVEYHSSKDYIPFKSRELKCKELSEALKDDNNCITGLQGMGGAGKTTLAKEVGKELEKSNKFDRVIVTVVSNTPDIKKIQDDIAAPLGLTESLTKCNESERARRLWSRLTNDEKILIILDDVWEAISFEDIGIPNRDNRNGCRILITSRNLRTCRSMQCDKTIELELLSEEDAWMLFKNHAGLSDRSSKSILDKGRKIAKECKGLPIAIAVTASSLKGEQRQEEWNVALKSLQKPNPTDGDDENLGKIYKCLRYSYDNMKNGKAKQLFLLCSVFREDEEIEVETLTRLSIAVGLVGEIDESYDERRSQVAVIINKLIDSCLLLKIDERWVKMHDLVREVALWIANEEVKAVNTSIEKDKSLVEKAKNLKYLLCEGKGMEVFSLGFDKSKLEILIVHMDEDDMDGDDMDEDDSVEIPDSFFQNMIRLRVLYLSYKTSRRRQTLSLIQSLTNIRSLYLCGFTLGDISILRNLQGLETLDFDRCSMDELPCEIAELAKLKLLRLFACQIKRNNPFKVIESCYSLEELYFLWSFPKDISTMHQIAELPKLRRFQILVGFPYFLPKERNILFVSKADGVFSEATFKHLMQTSNSIQLFGLEGGRRNLILPEDEGATLFLARLYLECISKLECLIDAKHIGSRIQNVFSNLVVLVLDQMENLKELCSVPLTFYKLTLMSLFGCPMLVTLFPLSTIQSLVLLERLSIRNCEQLESIITGEKEKEDLLFPNLKTLRIERCPKLEFVLRGVAGRAVPKLEYIQICDCVELKYIFGPYQHQQEEKDLHPELKDLQEEIVDGNNDNKSGASLFPNLKTLLIERCPKLEFVLPGVAGRAVPKLEEIQVCDCVELKYIFGPYQHQQKEKDLHQELKKDVIFATLKAMVLEGLPNLVGIFWKYDQYRCSSVKRSCSKDESKTEIESCVKRWCSKDGFKCNIYPWSSKYRHKLRTAKFPLDSDDQLQDCTLSSIIDGDTMNQRMSLMEIQRLVIKRCNNIKCVFPFPTSKMPPKLEVLAIIEASMLEEVFRWESDKKVEISDVKVAIFVELPNFNQGNEFHTIKDCLVHNCPKLSLNSTSTLETIQQIKSAIEKEIHFNYQDTVIKYTLKKTLDDLYEDYSNQTPTTKATEESPTKTKVQASSENELSSSQVNTSQSMHSNIVEDNQHVNSIQSNEFISAEKQNKETLEIEQEFDEKLPGLEIQSIATSPTNSEMIGKSCQSPSELDIPLNESHSLEDQSIQEESISEKTPRTTFSTHPKMEKISSRPLVSPPQKEVKRNVEEGTTSVYGKTIASPIDLGSENCEGQIAKPSFSIVNVEPTTIKDDDDGDAQETSKSVITHIMTNAPENLSQITKDSNFISIIRRELEQLVSKKHLAFENLELLINFLVKKPSVYLTNNALSDRYKGFAYTCLVELLIFLQTHSVLDVLESNHSEFVGLLQDVRKFGFDKNWLDDVERRALFPCLPSSENALKNLLDSKHTLIQHLEDLKHQLEESIIQQETQVLEVKATFSTPLGY